MKYNGKKKSTVEIATENVRCAVDVRGKK